MARQRERRHEQGNADIHKYEKTPKGFLMRAYRNIQSRAEGIIKPHIYAGLEYPEREEFYLWSSTSSSFWALFQEWRESGYDRRLSPSVNRIDPTRGYTLDNMEWITQSENSSRTRRNGG